MNTVTDFTVSVSTGKEPAISEITDFVQPMTGVPDGASMTPILTLLRKVLRRIDGDSHVSVLNNCFGNISKVYFVVSGTANKRKRNTDAILQNGRRRNIIADFEIRKTAGRIRIAFSGLFPVIT